MRKIVALALLASGAALLGPAPAAQAMPSAQAAMLETIGKASTDIEQVRRGGRGAFRHRGFRGYGRYRGHRSGYHRRWRSPRFYNYSYGAYPRYYRRPGIYFRF
jgi:hypothetical protein